MDPQATWNDLLDAWVEHDWSRLQEAAEDLLNWMNRNGFPPEMLPGRRMGAFWNEPVVRFCCEFAAGIAKRVLTNPNGIPDGVPFSLSCYECDVGAPDTWEEAIREGWTEIEFRPESVAENFLGACPRHKAEA